MIGRYETEAMRSIWHDETRFKRWTQVEVAACAAFHARGEISDSDMLAIREKSDHQSAARVREIEQETNHDVVAFVRAVAESVGEPAARHLHRGLTSSDIVDTALALTLVEALSVLIGAVQALREVIGQRATEHKMTICPGRTHGVHAEPTSFGLRLAGWHSELGRHEERLERAKTQIGYAKISGAVGTYSQTDPQFEAFVLNELGLQVEPVSTQVVPRDRHAEVLGALALMASGIERFAVEIRALQRTDIREAEEPFTPGQTGSSAMPHKRNPITSERLTGMARLMRGYMVAAYENVALWHDRDISHSSVERIMFPDAFHLAHYMVLKLTALIKDLRVYPEAMQRNIDRTGGLLFSQSVLSELLLKGLERQRAYKMVQRNAMAVWDGEVENLRKALSDDPEVCAVLGDDIEEALNRAFNAERYLKHIDVIFDRAGIARA